MLKQIFVFGVCIVLSLSAAAKESETNQSSHSGGGVNLKAGYIVGGVVGNGLDGYMKISDSFQVGLSYAKGTLDLTPLLSTPTAGITYNKVNLNAQVIEVYAKYFTGHSFAFTGGLAQRSVDSEIEISSSVGRINTKSSGTGMTAKVGIGNYWSWESGFTLGCEWLGYLMPLTSSYSATTTETGVVSGSISNLQTSAEDLGKIFAKSGSIQLFNLNIGFSF